MKLAAVTLEVFVEQNMNHKFLGTPLSASFPQGNPEVWIKRLDSIFKSKIATCSFWHLLLPRNTQLLPRGYRNFVCRHVLYGRKVLGLLHIKLYHMVVLLFLCSLNSKMFQQLLLSLVTVIKNRCLEIRIAGTCHICLGMGLVRTQISTSFLSCVGDRERSLWRDIIPNSGLHLTSTWRIRIWDWKGTHLCYRYITLYRIKAYHHVSVLDRFQLFSSWEGFGAMWLSLDWAVGIVAPI